MPSNLVLEKFHLSVSILDIMIIKIRIFSPSFARYTLGIELFVSSSIIRNFQEKRFCCIHSDYAPYFPVSISYIVLVLFHTYSPHVIRHSEQNQLRLRAKKKKQ